MGVPIVSVTRDFAKQLTLRANPTGSHHRGLAPQRKCFWIAAASRQLTRPASLTKLRIPFRAVNQLLFWEPLAASPTGRTDYRST